MTTTPSTAALTGVRILLIEDVASLRMVYRSILIHAGAEVRAVGSAGEGLAQFRERPVPLILLDLSLPDGDGIELMRVLRAQRHDLRIVVVTAHGGVGRAVEAMRAGAHDFLVKPFDSERLVAACRSAMQSLAPPPRRPRAIGGGKGVLIGSSRAMAGVARALAAAAPAMAPVLITGEPGTGKKLAARMLHALANRGSAPFRVLDAAATGRAEIEAALFSAEGALFGPQRGTLYLANLPALAPDLQRRLTPILATGAEADSQGRRHSLGNLRLMAGMDAAAEADLGGGRLDPGLYRLLAALRIDLPPLRSRDRDAAEIARAALADFGAEAGRSFQGFSAPVEELICHLPWPGNVTELLLVIRQIAQSAPGGTVTLDMMPRGLVPPPLQLVDRAAARPPLPAAGPAAPSRVQLAAAPANRPGPLGPGGPDPAFAWPDPKLSQVLSALAGRSLAEVERLVIEAAIADCQGNLPRAAKKLGIAPSTLYRKRQAWAGADAPQWRDG